MTKTSASDDSEQLRNALLSIGAGKKSVDILLKSKGLDKVIIPIYWRDGLVVKAHDSFLLQKLPDLLKSFGKEFPDGEIRWDPDYDEENNAGAKSDVAIRVYFNYQEDDQGDHWSPKPTPMEDENYQRMVKRYSYSGQKPVPAQAVLQSE
ncbi:MAG: hypothetical protein OK455_00185 [Thaumarchaeota archaeon]|nr:hypothetical protein [Nitrososphaerota archaeon]